MPAPLVTAALVFAFLLVAIGAPPLAAGIVGGAAVALEAMIAGGDPPV